MKTPMEGSMVRFAMAVESVGPLYLLPILLGSASRFEVFTLLLALWASVWDLFESSWSRVASMCIHREWALSCFLCKSQLSLAWGMPLWRSSWFRYLLRCSFVQRFSSKWFGIYDFIPLAQFTTMVFRCPVRFHVDSQ
eukprot:Gb_32198 [translate_table: standard]